MSNSGKSHSSLNISQDDMQINGTAKNVEVTGSQMRMVRQSYYHGISAQIICPRKFIVYGLVQMSMPFSYKKFQGGGYHLHPENIVQIMWFRESAYKALQCLP